MMTAPAADTQRLGAAIAEAITAADITKAALAAEVGSIVRGRPYASSMVTEWITGNKGMRPEQVMAAERALSLRPGTLCQHLGYLPVGALPVVDSEEALSRDIDLTPHQRDALVRAYREAVATTRAARERRRGR
jgi:hypothetical protein